MKSLLPPPPPLRSKPRLPQAGMAGGPAARRERAVALVITLVMLSVVTFMAITFLAVSRRERAAVTVVEEQSRARQMAEAAVARVQAEILARIMASSNVLDYDFLVSTNLINPYGFNPGLPATPADPRNATNVNYEYVAGGAPGSVAANVDYWARNIANLQYDPRPPVFVRTNDDRTRPLEFRYFLDLNRNGRFESNGVLPVLDANGRWVNTNGLPWRSGEVVLSNFFVGDPEWVGVLQHPGAPHGPTNRFVGRMAYLVQPAGKSLDLNFMGNHALRPGDTTLQNDGYYRNQGVGSWELNLAAFLRDLNTNVTRNYTYIIDPNTRLAQPSVSEAARDALAFLRYRYDSQLTNLLSVRALFGRPGADAFAGDFIDGYTDGPAFTATNLLGLATDNDLPDRPWPGADAPRMYVELQELFDTNKLIEPAGNGRLPWMTRLLMAQSGLSSYDRYTLYRMLGQVGTESSPAHLGRVNLNYVDLPGFAATNFVSWNDPDLPAGNAARGIPAFRRTGAELFFHAVADRLLVAARRTNIVRFGNNLYTNFYIGDALIRPGLSLTNILLYPHNEYSPELHRLLQLAVNLYDATTNRTATTYPHLPTVFRPVFGTSPIPGTDETAVYIRGYEEVTNATFLTASLINVRNLEVPADRAALANEPRALVYNVPFLIGAKKGLPNFNEFSLRNVAQITRKLEVRKRTPLDVRPFQTNLLYLVTATNQFGIELWNAYATNYPRPLRVRVLGRLSLALIDGLRTNLPLAFTNVAYHADIRTNSWPSNTFILPVLHPAVLASSAAYRPVPTPNLINAGTNTPFVPGLGFYMPDWTLRATNQFLCAVLDEQANRIVDFVTLGNMRTVMNVTRELAGRQTLSATGAPTEPANTWDTNRVGGVNDRNAPMIGVENQMQISLGNLPVSEAQWRSYSQLSAEGLDKPKSIDRFRLFCGETPLVYTSERERQQLRAELGARLFVQAPYSPSRKLYQDSSWQANDPLVHYLVTDLLDPQNRPDDPDRTNTVRFAIPPTAVLTNSNLGRLNERYSPWGDNPQLTPSLTAYDNRLKDPGVYRPDDWEFPTNRFPNLGWIGRVHRGTPWQTVYLKSGVISQRQWLRWAGNAGTHPTNDWLLLDAFTVAPNENAARGLLSVNQSGLAAWSAVLSGLSVLTNLTPANVPPGTKPEFRELIIQPDAAGGLNPYPQLRRIVDGINRARLAEVTNNQQNIPVFDRLGRILATPELTVASPFLNPSNLVTDAVLERIPQQILSLLRADEPRFVVYAYGQALREAPNSLYLQAGTFNRLCTNYQITAEFAAKAVVRIEGPPVAPRAVIESYQELPPQ